MFERVREHVKRKYEEKLAHHKPLQQLIRSKKTNPALKPALKAELRSREKALKARFNELNMCISLHERKLTASKKSRSEEYVQHMAGIVEACKKVNSAWNGRDNYGVLIANSALKATDESPSYITFNAVRSYSDALRLITRAQKKGVLPEESFWSWDNGCYEAVNIDIYAVVPSVCIVQVRRTEKKKKSWWPNQRRSYYLLGWTNARRTELVWEELTGQLVHAAVARDNSPSYPILAVLKKLIAEGREDLPLWFWSEEAEKEPRPAWARISEIKRAETPRLDNVYDIEGIRKILTFGLEVEGNGVATVRGYKVVSEHCGQEARSVPFTFGTWRGWGETSTKILIENSRPAANAGVHVHVGLSKFFARPSELLLAVRRLVATWKEIEDDIAVIADRNPERLKYCARWEEGISAIENGLAENARPKSKKAVMENIAKRHGRRRKAMNLLALEKHGTVEFRLWNSTRDWNYVKNAVIISTAVVAYAISTRNRDAGNINSDFFEFLESWKRFFGRDEKESPLRPLDSLDELDDYSGFDEYDDIDE